MCMAATYVAAIAPAGARAVTHPDLQAAHDTGSIGAYRQDGVTPPLLSPKGSPSAIRQLTPVTWCPLVAPSPTNAKSPAPRQHLGKTLRRQGRHSAYGPYGHAPQLRMRTAAGPSHTFGDTPSGIGNTRYGLRPMGGGGQVESWGAAPQPPMGISVPTQVADTFGIAPPPRQPRVGRRLAAVFREAPSGCRWRAGGFGASCLVHMTMSLPCIREYLPGHLGIPLVECRT